MSPRRTLMNWGTSSRPVLRINRPARVMRGSSSPLLRHAPVGPSAWSAGKISTRTHILQYSNGQTVGGASVDLNESKQADFGAWEFLPPSLLQPWYLRPWFSPQPSFLWHSNGR